MFTTAPAPMPYCAERFIRLDIEFLHSVGIGERQIGIHIRVVVTAPSI